VKFGDVCPIQKLINTQNVRARCVAQAAATPGRERDNGALHVVCSRAAVHEGAQPRAPLHPCASHFCVSTQPAGGVLSRGGALTSARFSHGVQPCSEPQCSAAAYPSSTSIGARGAAQAAALNVLAREACTPLSTHNVQSCFESLCCALRRSKSKAVRRRRTASLAGQAYADMDALAEHISNVIESVCMRVSVCVGERVCVCE